ncbi:MAG: hypothetical protein AB7G23_15915 [Vicinamibacterales bacterium]
MFRRSFARSLVLLLGGALVASTGLVAATWSTPKAIGSSNLNFMYANNASMAASSHPLAQAVVVWAEPSNNAIRYAVRRDGVWVSGKTLASARASANEMVTDPQVVIDASGVATVVWASTKEGPMKYCSRGLVVYRCPEILSYAKTATLAPGATVWTKADLSAKGYSVLDVQVGLDGAGNAVAAWSYRAAPGAVPVLQSATRSAGGDWASPVDVTAVATLQTPRLAVGTSGHASLVWQETVTTAPSLYALRSAERSPTGEGWVVEDVSLTTQAHRMWSLRTAIDPEGTTVAVWDDGSTLELARRVGGTWGAPTILAPAQSGGPELAVDEAGRVLVSWLEFGLGPDGSNLIEARLFAPDGAPTASTWSVGTQVAPSAALAADGSGVLAWLDETDFNIYAATLLPDGQWSPPQVVSTGPALSRAAWGMRVAVSAAPGHQASAAWLSVAGLYGQLKVFASSLP